MNRDGGPSDWDDGSRDWRLDAVLFVSLLKGASLEKYSSKLGGIFPTASILARAGNNQK